MAFNQFQRQDLPPEWTKFLKNYKYVLAGILAIILLWSTFFQVRPEELGVITRFGKYVRSEESGPSPEISNP